MTYRLNLYILNGALKGDHPGEFTFFSGGKTSTIDYIAISRDLIPFAKALKIMPKPESDHFPVLLHLHGFSQEIHLTESYRLPLQLTEGFYKRVKWTLQVNQRITDLLKTERLTSLRTSLISAENANALMETYRNIVQELQSQLSQGNNTERTQLQRQPHQQSQTWFDKECLSAKKALSTVYQSFKFNPTSTTAQDLLLQKRQYKQLLTRKKREAIKNNWERLIEAVKAKDTTTFWRITSNIQSRDQTAVDSQISPASWEVYFQELYRDTYSENAGRYVCPNISMESLPSWPPVTTAEIERLVAQLKPGKAPGEDAIPPEVIKNNLDFWSPILASLFTCIDKYGQIPKDWGMAVIVPIYKRKGRQDDPANYRPISLLNTISKIYTRHLYWKLLDWMEQENILAEEQAGFREGRSTIDQCIVLQHLIEKYTSQRTSSLYAAFIDFRAAFDSISRIKLWEKLGSTSIDKRLLQLIRSLHEGTTLKIRCSSQGHLTRAVETEKGVKQGCTLAPLLFNFYINSMVEHLYNLDYHPPKLAERHLSILLYADDAVLLSRTQVGLKRALRALAKYCSVEQLHLNFQKTKIMEFAKRPKNHTWRLDGHNIEQVSRFKYLGVFFHCTGNRKVHADYVAETAQKSSHAILKFLKTGGGHYIPAALKLFEAKPIAQMMYGAQLGPYPNFAPLEQVQSKFLRSMMQVPRCVSNAILRLETGLVRVEARAWIATLNYWLHLSHSPCGLAPLTLRDEFQSTWNKVVATKIATLGFSQKHLLSMGWDQAKVHIRQRILDTERQSDLACSPVFNISADNRYTITPMAYLTNLEVPNHRKAFTLARCHALPSAVLEGRYRKTPALERLCPCEPGHIETIEHVLLQCMFYRDIRINFITPWLLKHPGRTERYYTSLLLSDSCSAITYSVARFCAAAISIRRTMTDPTGPVARAICYN
uniref:ribonuclease H n=1 Tax=Anolis carolinensis TaxID=28377 RepID=A0A803T0U9_ANOCA